MLVEPTLRTGKVMAVGAIVILFGDMFFVDGVETRVIFTFVTLRANLALRTFQLITH